MTAFHWRTPRSLGQNAITCVFEKVVVVVIVVILFVVVVVSESQRFRESGSKGVIESN